MGEVFEVRSWDGAGRLGDLEVPRAGVSVETPALLPVINPHLETISPTRLQSEFGIEILITNGYILYRSDDYRERALSEGLHDLYGFDGAIVTDSGSFQLSEYGEISVSTEEILAFQDAIGADIGTPVDIPTAPDADRQTAEDELAKTQRRLERAEAVETGSMLVNAPIQGGRFPDLREAAARQAAETTLDVFPIGGVVPLLNAYRYGDVVEVVSAATRGLPTDVPVHLFGAGHPMTFALAVALGCDLFDSAAYAIYARDDRYLTVRGTEHLADLDYLPCACPVCVDTTPGTLRSLDASVRERRLAEHNLHVTQAELRRIKQALRSGTLFELVEARARSHPSLLDGYRALLDEAHRLEATDPVSKDTFFYLSTESARRPEVVRHHDRLARLHVQGSILLTEGGPSDRFDESWRVVPPFGPFPRALSETYPLTAEVPARRDPTACRTAAEGVRRLVEANPAVSFTLAHWGWPAQAVATVPESVAVVDLAHEDDSRDPTDPELDHHDGLETAAWSAEPTDGDTHHPPETDDP